MGLIESELTEALHSPIKRKANRTWNLRAIAKRRTSGASEVMVKITGFGKGASHAKAHLRYLTRDVSEMENDRGEIINGKDELSAFFKDWTDEFNDSKRYKNQRDTMHLILSMPPSVDSESVRNAVREFNKDTFGKNHEYVFVLHTNEAHPHCHISVKCAGMDGKRLNPRKADLQQWREAFAEKLREQGVDAEATPRRSRGIVRKAMRRPIRHIEDSVTTDKPRASTVKNAKVEEVRKELADEMNGLPVQPGPWEEKIHARQEKVRHAWLAAAEALESEQTRKTFNGKEAHNARPVYERISRERARAGQLAASLYQSNLATPGPDTPPRPIARLRNLSGLDVVHHRRASEVFLHPDASNRMGRYRTTDNEMRWSGIGNSRPPKQPGAIASYQGTAADNKALAKQIRRYVEAMPPVETERDQIKRSLIRQLSPAVSIATSHRNNEREGPDLER